MPKYRKKPVVIEALLWTGNALDIPEHDKEWLDDAIFSGDVCQGLDGTMKIATLEGDMVANIGDYIIKGINGELYPCKPDIFHKTYEEVE